MYKLNKCQAYGNENCIWLLLHFFFSFYGAFSTSWMLWYGCRDAFFSIFFFSSGIYFVNVCLCVTRVFRFIYSRTHAIGELAPAPRVKRITLQFSSQIKCMKKRRRRRCIAGALDQLTNSPNMCLVVVRMYFFFNVHYF